VCPAQATARLHQASGAAVSAALKTMVDSSAPASTRLRAVDIDARVAALERATEASEQRRCDYREGKPCGDVRAFPRDRFAEASRAAECHSRFRFLSVAEARRPNSASYIASSRIIATSARALVRMRGPHVPVPGEV
jgi:hypothetical protein